MIQPFPKVDPGNYVVLCAEGMTGAVLALSGQRALADAEIYRVFGDLQTARAWVRETVAAHPLWECNLYDETGTSIEVVKNIEALDEAARGSSRKSLWRRLLGSLDR